MNFRQTAVTTLLQWGVIGAFALSAHQVYAQDKSVAQEQRDAQISVWVDNAPLTLFVSELATMTGREALIEGDLNGQVSGRFDGSMNDTLASVGPPLNVLFDVDETTLGVVSDSARSSVSVALNNAEIDESVKSGLSDNLLHGNTVVWGDDIVQLSGHPAFVKRAARTVTSAVSQATRERSITVNDQSVVEPVVDYAAQVLTEEDSSLSSQGQSAVDSASKDIEWVSDIPGFNTF